MIFSEDSSVNMSLDYCKEVQNYNISSEIFNWFNDNIFF